MTCKNNDVGIEVEKKGVEGVEHVQKVEGVELSS